MSLCNFAEGHLLFFVHDDIVFTAQSCQILLRTGAYLPKMPLHRKNIPNSIIAIADMLLIFKMVSSLSLFLPLATNQVKAYQYMNEPSATLSTIIADSKAVKLPASKPDAANAASTQKKLPGLEKPISIDFPVS